MRDRFRDELERYTLLVAFRTAVTGGESHVHVLCLDSVVMPLLGRVVFSVIDCPAAVLSGAARVKLGVNGVTTGSAAGARESDGDAPSSSPRGVSRRCAVKPPQQKTPSSQDFYSFTSLGGSYWCLRDVSIPKGAPCVL